MQLFRRSNLPKGRVTVSPTYKNFRPTIGTSSAILGRRDLDPNLNVHDEGKYVEEPDAKLERLSWTDEHFSFSVWVKTRSGSLPTHVKLWDPDGVEVPKSDRLIKKLLADFDRILGSKPDEKGYDNRTSMDLFIDQQFRSVVTFGAVSGELVLDKKLNPSKVVLIHPKSVHWSEKNDRYIPWQKVSPNDSAATQTLYGSYGRHVVRMHSPHEDKDLISLDIPTFFFSRLDASLLEPYHISPSLPVLNLSFARRQFINDMQLVLRRIAWPRLSAKVVSEQIRKSIPEHITEPAERVAFVEQELSNLRVVLEQMQPGQALVHADYFDVSMLESVAHAKGSLDADPMLSVMNRLNAQSSKTYDAVLGSEEAPSPLQIYVESMSLKGYQRTVQDFMSKMLSMLLRLQGKNMRATFHFADFEMRPPSELEGSRSMRMTNDLKLVYLGVMTPSEFSIRNSGTPLPSDSVLEEFFNNFDLAERALGIQPKPEADEVEPSDTDTPNSPGKRKTPEGDGRSEPEASTKRGKKPSAKREGKIKKSRTGTTRTPRSK